MDTENFRLILLIRPETEQTTQRLFVAIRWRHWPKVLRSERKLQDQLGETFDLTQLMESVACWSFEDTLLKIISNN